MRACVRRAPPPEIWPLLSYQPTNHTTSSAGARHLQASPGLIVSTSTSLLVMYGVEGVSYDAAYTVRPLPSVVGKHIASMPWGERHFLAFSLSHTYSLTAAAVVGLTASPP